MKTVLLISGIFLVYQSIAKSMFAKVTYPLKQNFSKSHVSSKWQEMILLFAYTNDAIYVGIPEKTWNDALQTCTLPTLDQLKSVGTNVSPILRQNIKKAWTGTRVKFSHWSAFVAVKSLTVRNPFHNERNTVTICCSDDITTKSVNIDGTKMYFKDCLSKCSTNQIHTHFAIKGRTCRCLSVKPQLDEKHHGKCRKECQDSNESLCSSGNGQMVFEFLKDINVLNTKQFFEEECLISVRQDGHLINTLEDCKAKHTYDCENDQVYYERVIWNKYQERCLHEGTAVLFSNLSRQLAGNTYWSPMFRTQWLIPKGVSASNEECIAMVIDDKSVPSFSVENCTSLLPFVCLLAEETTNTADFSTTNAVLLPAVIAVSIFCFFLVLMTIALAIKLRKVMKLLEEIQSPKSATRLNIVSYTGLKSRDEGCYRELNSDCKKTDTEHVHRDYENEGISQSKELDHKKYISMGPGFSNRSIMEN